MSLKPIFFFYVTGLDVLPAYVSVYHLYGFRPAELEHLRALVTIPESGD